MNSLMETSAMNIVTETAQVYRGKRWVMISSGYLRNYLSKNNTHLLKCCSILGKRVHNQCPATHSTADVVDSAGRTAHEEHSSPSPAGLKVPAALLHCTRAENCLQPCHILPCSLFALNDFVYTN